MDFWTTALTCLMAIFVRDILRSLIGLAALAAHRRSKQE